MVILFLFSQICYLDFLVSQINTDDLLILVGATAVLGAETIPGQSNGVQELLDVPAGWVGVALYDKLRNKKEAPHFDPDFNDKKN